MRIIEFFELVKKEELTKLDIHNQVQDLTDNFDEDKLNLLCEDFDIYFLYESNEWESSFSHEEIQNKIHELEKTGNKVPVMSDSKRHPKCVGNYFKIPEDRKNKLKINWTDEGIKRSEEFFSEMKKNQEKYIDIEKLMDPFGLEFYELYRLRNLLILLKAEHTNSELLPIYKSVLEGQKSVIEMQKIEIHPIFWLKSRESLKTFISELKKKEIIEDRNTEDIIQEHFKVDGKVPTKEPKPIKWLINIKYLPYLINKLIEENIISIKGNKHEITILHFVSATENELSAGSLSSSLSQLKNKKVDEVIYSINSLVDKIKG